MCRPFCQWRRLKYLPQKIPFRINISTSNHIGNPPYVTETKINLCYHIRDTSKKSTLGTITVNVRRVTGFNSLKYRHHHVETDHNGIIRQRVQPPCTQVCHPNGSIPDKVTPISVFRQWDPPPCRWINESTGRTYRRPSLGVPTNSPKPTSVFRWTGYTPTKLVLVGYPDKDSGPCTRVSTNRPDLLTDGLYRVLRQRWSDRTSIQSTLVRCPDKDSGSCVHVPTNRRNRYTDGPDRVFWQIVRTLYQYSDKPVGVPNWWSPWNFPTKNPTIVTVYR